MLRSPRGSRLRDGALAALSIALAACGGAERQRAAPSTPAPVAVEVSTEVAPPACRIDALRAESLAVRPEGGEPFLVSITDGALSFVVTDEGGALHAEVERPLRFTARAPVEEQGLATRAEGDLAAGALHAAAPLPVIALTRAEHGIAAHLQLGRRSLTSNGVELVVGPVSLPCESIAALSEAEPSVTSALPRRVSGGELRVAGVLPLVLRPLRIAPAQLEVRPLRRDDFVPLWRIDRQGESARVAIAFGDGSRLEGWVSMTALREPSAEEAERVERMLREEGSSPSSYGVLGAPEPAPPSAQADEYVGPASLRPGARVLAEAGGGPWATSAAQPLEVRVRWQRGQRWAQLLEVPGMWITPERAWVERGDLAIPEL